MSQFLTIDQAADFLGCSVNTLYDWRYKRIGPRSGKIGGRVAYRQVDLDTYVEAQFADGTPAA